MFYLFFQPVKVVNDDSDEEVQREERTNDNKDNKIQIRSKTVVAFWLLVDLGKKRKKIIRIINKTVMRYACVSSRRGQLRKETGANQKLSRVTWPDIDMRRQAQTRDKKALLESGINAHPVNGEPRKRSKAESFSESSPLLYFPATRTKSLLKRLLIEDIKFCPLQSAVIVFSSFFAETIGLWDRFVQKDFMPSR